MTRFANLFFILAWVLAASGSTIALADENTSANRLVVQAVGLLNQARNELDPQRRLELITTVEANLNRVIARYPGSDAAVKLATGQSIGSLSLEIVASEKARYEAEKSQYEAEACLVTSDRQCLWVQTLDIANEIGDAYVRAFALIAIATAQTEVGDLRQAQRTIDEAGVITKEISDADTRTFTLIAIATSQTEVGDLRQARDTIGEALATAKMISDVESRTNALTEIAVVQAGTGDTKEALAIAMEFSSLAQRAYVLSRIAAILAEAGRAKEALAIVQVITHANDRADALIAIATAQTEAGDLGQARETFDEALAVANEVGHAGVLASTRTMIRNSRIRSIATAQAAAGDTKDALDTAMEFGLLDKRVGLLSRIAEIQAGLGHKKEALAIAKKASVTATAIHSSRERALALVSIGRAEAKAGDLRQARETFDGAIAIFKKESYGELFRVTILLLLATLQTEAGDLMHARETIDEALVIAREISDVGSRASKLTEVAIAQAEAGDTKKAFAAAMVLTGYQRVQVLVHIASNTPD